MLPGPLLLLLVTAIPALAPVAPQTSTSEESPGPGANDEPASEAAPRGPSFDL